ncbi:MAG: DUF288 domain-containing protein [Sedimentisphaerales bacterium]|nr:DUF288 domain-containing protein [Sedimentisphaerales bacterium]
MDEHIAVVITSVSAPNRAMTEIAEGCKQKGYRFIVIGDESSPSDFYIDGCDFYNLEDQIKTGFEFAQMCPRKHYARKNIGYLIAIKNGASIIVETDDDNIPYDTFWRQRRRNLRVKTVEKPGWVNIYRYFTDANIWPRGIPLEEINNEPISLESLNVRDMDCPIQQGLADENPDVDAIYRLILPLPQSFFKDRYVAISKETWCPFNSQNTTWWRDAFALLYLPSYCSFRMTDIWRGFVAQRIAKVNGWGILFHEPSVWQQRNEHNLMRDFRDEIPGYLNNAEICREFERLDLEPGADKIAANLRLCYEILVAKDRVDRRELELLDMWNNHINELSENRQKH